MRGPRPLLLVALLMLALLGWLQFRLWFGVGGERQVDALSAQVEQQKAANIELQRRNDALAAEVRDLKEGVAAVEERARSELGMIKPGELFYRVVEDPAQRASAPDPDATGDANAGEAD